MSGWVYGIRLYLLTAAHCIDGSRSVEILFSPFFPFCYFSCSITILLAYRTWYLLLSIASGQTCFFPPSPSPSLPFLTCIHTQPSQDRKKSLGSPPRSVPCRRDNPTQAKQSTPMPTSQPVSQPASPELYIEKKNKNKKNKNKKNKNKREPVVHCGHTCTSDQRSTPTMRRR